MKRVLAAVVVATAAVGCGSSAPGEPDASIGADTTVVAFDGEHVSFGEENRRVVDVPVTFPPADQQFDQMTLSFALRCPNNRCDWWDRVGWLAVVENPGAEDERAIEIHRFITPYRVGASWTVNVTDLRPLLSGEVTMRVFIDTWVGPGHANGDGWLVDASFELHGGVPEPEPFAVVPIWPVHSVGVGDPAAPMDEGVEVALPEGVRAARLRTLVTGHGQGNADNCAEFCPKSHSITVAGVAHDRDVWRDDCDTTAAPNQAGTWQYPRAGWCPGAEVHAWYETVSEAVIDQPTVTVEYAVEDYENTCRPDGPCTNCVAGTCEYDGGAHTPPSYYLSSLLILYR